MEPCPKCKKGLPTSVRICPHCGEPCDPPNIRAARRSEEVAGLQRRLEDAQKKLEEEGCSALAAALSTALAGSRAVISRPLGDMERLAARETESLGTFFEQIDAGTRYPEDSGWDWWRQVTEHVLFPGYRNRIRFASLTLNDRGLSIFGDCFVTLRTPMIEARTSVFEENNVMFFQRQDLAMSKQVELMMGQTAILCGYKATWEDRYKLGLAKLGPRIHRGMTEDDLPTLVQRCGDSPEQADFIEVHIYGDITINAVEKIVMTSSKSAQQRVLQGWREKLLLLGVTLEVL